MPSPLNDPEVMGKDVFGYARLKKILDAWGAKYDLYFDALTLKDEADYFRQKMDDALRRIVPEGEDFFPFGLEADSGPAHHKALEVGLGFLGVDGHELALPQVPQGLHSLWGLLDVGHISGPVVAAGGLDKALEVHPLVPPCDPRTGRQAGEVPRLWGPRLRPVFLLRAGLLPGPLEYLARHEEPVRPQVHNAPGGGAMPGPHRRAWGAAVPGGNGGKISLGRGHTVLVHSPGVRVLRLKADSSPAHHKALEVGLGLLGIDGHELALSQVPQGHKYVTPQEVERCRVRIGGPGVLLFLEGMEEKR